MPESARQIDPNGFLVVKGCPLSTFGVFDYSAGQIGLPGDPNRIVKVFRPEYAVSDPEAVNSFKNVPLVDEHEMLSGFDDDQQNADPDEKGVSGILTGNVYYKKPWMLGDIKVFSRGMKDKVLAKIKDDLSLGFGCKYRLEPGNWNGQDYEVVQDHIRGNHLALVDDGRIPGARVLDGLCFDHLNFDKISHKGTQMKKPIPVNRVKFLQQKTAQLAKLAKDAGETGLKEGEQALDADANVAERIKAVLPQLMNDLQEFFGQEATEPAHEDPEETVPTATEPVDDVTDLPESPEAPAGEDPEAGAPEMTEEHPEESSTGGGDLQSLISQCEALLAEIKNNAGGATDNEDMPQEGEDEDPDVMPSEETTDKIEGLQENSEKGAMMKTDDNKLTMDAAIKGYRVDEAKKVKIYNRLSRVIGAFSHATMDSKEIAKYGVKKLGIPAPKGQEIIALDAYFAGVEKLAAVQKAAKDKKEKEVSAMDSSIWNAPSELPELNAYLKGSK